MQSSHDPSRECITFSFVSRQCHQVLCIFVPHTTFGGSQESFAKLRILKPIPKSLSVIGVRLGKFVKLFVLE